MSCPSNMSLDSFVLAAELLLAEQRAGMKVDTASKISAQTERILEQIKSVLA